MNATAISPFLMWFSVMAKTRIALKSKFTKVSFMLFFSSITEDSSIRSSLLGRASFLILLFKSSKRDSAFFRFSAGISSSSDDEPAVSIFKPVIPKIRWIKFWCICTLWILSRGIFITSLVRIPEFKTSWVSSNLNLKFLYLSTEVTAVKTNEIPKNHHTYFPTPSENIE